jgi:polar amino acid transport system substrate-binding protein
MNPAPGRGDGGRSRWRRGTALAAVGVLLLAAGCSEGLPEADHAAPLVVGLDPNYPPFEMINEAGELSGIDVELARALGRHLNRPVVFEKMSFDGLIPALQTGRIELIVSAMTITEERRKAVDFSDPYFRTGLSLLVGKNSGIRSVADLNPARHRIAVVNGTTGHIYVRKNLKAFAPEKVLILKQDAVAALEVAQGNADAFVYDSLSVFKHHQKNPETTTALLQTFQSEDWGIVLRKGNDALKRQINGFLAEFKARKGLDPLMARYFSGSRSELEAAGIGFPDE